MPVWSRLYDERAISIGYAGDGSVGARRKPELLSGLEDLDIGDLSLGGFEVLPVGGDSAVVTYRADFRTGRGIDSSVMATSVWHPNGLEWRTKFFQATAAPAVSGDGDRDSAPRRETP